MSLCKFNQTNPFHQIILSFGRPASLQQQVFAATTYVNCWHVSPDESAFLWSSYSSVSDGLAIRSTIGDLCRALEVENRAVYVGEIKYIDYSTEVIPGGNTFNAFYFKRKSFAPERELRCCFSHLVEGVGIGPEALSKNPKGIAIKCDLNSLVQELFVSPYSETWFEDVVRSVNAKFGADFKLKRSSLMDDAIL